MVGDHPLAKAARVLVLLAIHSPFPIRSHHCIRAVLVEAARPTSGIGAERDGHEEIQYRPPLRRILGQRVRCRSATLAMTTAWTMRRSALPSQH